MAADYSKLALVGLDVIEHALRAGSANSINSEISLIANACALSEDLVVAAHPDAGLQVSIVFITLGTDSTYFIDSVVSLLTDTFF